MNDSIDLYTNWTDHPLSNYTTVHRPPPGTNYDTCSVFKLIFYGVVIGTLCLFGLLGNILSILVIQKDRSNKVAGFLLQSLAIADNALLLISFMTFAIIYGFSPYFRNGSIMAFIPYIRKYVEPLGNIAQTATIWLTVLLALNRYIAICLPFQAPKLCTATRVRMQVACVSAFAIIFNFPRFFQHSIVTVTDHHNRTMLRSRPTAIGENTIFDMVYVNALYSILVLILPLLLLIFLKGRLIMEMHRMKMRRKSVGCDAYPKEENITLVMVIIVVVFVVCHTPDRVLQILKYIVDDKYWLCNGALSYFAAICNLLVIVNSSTNFLIYYFIRKRFRRILFAKLCCCIKPKSYRYPQTQDTVIDMHRLSLLSNTEQVNQVNQVNGHIGNGKKRSF